MERLRKPIPASSLRGDCGLVFGCRRPLLAGEDAGALGLTLGHVGEITVHNQPRSKRPQRVCHRRRVRRKAAGAQGRRRRCGCHRVPFSANGRARTMGETQGFVKFVVDAGSDEILGAHMIGPNVADLLAEVVLAMEYRGSAEDIGITVHSHPTLSETVKEAALAALGRAIHM